jgi:hypothetical protein
VRFFLPFGVRFFFFCSVSSVQLHDKSGRSIPLRWGFHAVPSLRLLHLHVVSSDLDSPALKNKKHWNSFATPFFVSIPTIKKMIAQAGTPAQMGAAALFHPSAAAAGGARPLTLQAQLAARAPLESGPLHCNRQECGIRVLNMPELRKHLELCNKPYPS